ncbi:hypothetical protein CR194_13740 [Salipaludibacillus keqinensis]|uniref:Bacterial Pleckstrin homology domain-containing protein n=1 Tax=Salipaludibacillus keqinensis TaxID=2045207 RepID=A0A323TJ44_9BACI|nr:PH domain-containing protein [Salipaludibacillus keqinensis]PYZ92713.1 hypothetical protein CR194_13740 [Salipaludibacillus keqinensis]
MNNRYEEFIAVTGKPLPKPYRKLEKTARILEIVMLLLIVPTFLFLVIHPNYSLLDFPVVISWIILLIGFTASWNWSFHLGWNQRLDGRMRYVLEEDGLTIYFHKKQLRHVPYDHMKSVGSLETPLTKLKQVQLFGRKYFVTPGMGSGTCNEYPTILIYSTTIDEGTLIHANFETILLSPEQEEQFQEALKRKIHGETTDQHHSI